MSKTRKVEVIQTPKPGTLVLQEPKNQKPTLKELGGSNSDDFNNSLMNGVANTLRIRATDKSEDRTQMLQAAAATLMSLKPEDESEGMLIGADDRLQCCGDGVLSACDASRPASGK